MNKAQQVQISDLKLICMNDGNQDDPANLLERMKIRLPITDRSAEVHHNLHRHISASHFPDRRYFIISAESDRETVCLLDADLSVKQDETDDLVQITPGLENWSRRHPGKTDDADIVLAPQLILRVDQNRNSVSQESSQSAASVRIPVAENIEPGLKIMRNVRSDIGELMHLSGSATW
jgi:hypothetical protein